MSSASVPILIHYDISVWWLSVSFLKSSLTLLKAKACLRGTLLALKPDCHESAAKGRKIYRSPYPILFKKGDRVFHSWSIRCPVLIIRQLPADWTGRSCHPGRALQNQFAALAVVESR